MRAKFAISVVLLIASFGMARAAFFQGGTIGSSGSGALPSGVAYAAPVLTIGTAGTGNGSINLLGTTSGGCSLTTDATGTTNATSCNLSLPNVSNAFTFTGANTMSFGLSASNTFVWTIASVAKLQLNTSSMNFINGLNLAFTGGKGQHILTQAANNDLSGRCTAAAATTCTVTFTTAYTAAPACTATDETGNTTVTKVTPATGSLVITTAASSSDAIDYLCFGSPN